MGWKQIAAVAGLFLFFASMGLAILLARGESQAERRDRLESASFPQDVPVDPCADDLLIEVAIARRVMSERSSQALRVTLTNDMKEPCPAVLSLSAPRFEVNPPQLLRTATVPAGGTTDIIWVLAPPEPGTYELIVAAGDRATVVGLTVTNVLGLRAWQIELLSLLGTVLGPMLTVPWWYELWQKRRKEQDKQEKAADNKRRLPFE